jgi:hypothetical protein
MVRALYQLISYHAGHEGINTFMHQIEYLLIVGPRVQDNASTPVAFSSTWSLSSRKSRNRKEPTGPRTPRAAISPRAQRLALCPVANALSSLDLAAAHQADEAAATGARACEQACKN